MRVSKDLNQFGYFKGFPAQGVVGNHGLASESTGLLISHFITLNYIYVTWRRNFFLLEGQLFFSNKSTKDRLNKIKYIIIFIPCFFLPQGSKNDKAFMKCNLTLKEQGNRYIQSFCITNNNNIKRKTNTFSLVDLLSLKINLDRLSDQRISNCIYLKIERKLHLCLYHFLP